MAPFTLPGRRDTRLSDDRLHALLLAGESADVPLSELCAEHALSIPEYCVLKKKYGGLSLDELQAARRAEPRGPSRSTAATGTALFLLMTVSVGVYVAWGRDASGRAPQPSTRADAAGSAPGAARIDGRPVAPAEPKRTRPVAAADGGAAEVGFAVQVAALPDARSARLAADALIARGYPAYVTPTNTSAVHAFRVRVGPFHTRHQAELLVPDLVREGYDGAWITR